MTPPSVQRLVYDYEPTERQALAHSIICDELLYGGASGGGKDLALDTPVCTTQGWSTQGLLETGDKVLAPGGLPTVVVATHDVELNVCYRLTFSNGESITAGERHLWTVATTGDRLAFESAYPMARKASGRSWPSPDALTRVWDYTRTIETRSLPALLAEGEVSIPYCDPFGTSAFIAAVEVVPTVPTRCITVADPRGLYAVGEAMIPTHNSHWARAEAVRLAVQVPGSRTLLLRRNFPQLERSVVEPLRLEIPAGLARYNDSKHVWKFSNGSVLELGHMQAESDYLNYLSAEYSLVIFEELTQFTEKQYRGVLGRLRAAGPVAERMAHLGLRPRAISTTNPSGIGHQWVKARFVDPGVQFKAWRPEPSDDDESPGTRCYIPAKLDDNPHMDPGYARQLDSMDPVMRRAYRDGDWDILEGVRFPQFRRSVHVIEPEQLAIPMVGVPRAVGVDYGVSHHFAALWGARLNDGLIVIYRELYERDLTAQQQAEKVRDAESAGERTPTRPIPIVLDPATWARTVISGIRSLDPNQPAVGSAAWFFRNTLGMAVKKARNDRVAGWALLDELMRVRVDGLPRILIYSSCTNLIRVIPQQMRSVQNPDDLNTHGEDDLLDALRYLLFELLVGGNDRAGHHGKDQHRHHALRAITADMHTMKF